MADLISMFDRTEAAYGLPSGYLARTAQIESSMNPAARNPSSSAGGLFQFIDSTAAQYGLEDRFDPIAATDAAGRLARDNAAVLRRGLGREPTAGELYLAHQQGGGGALALLRNQGRSAADVVGSDAARLNRGAGMSAGDFANQWLAKFDGVTPRAVTTTTIPNQADPEALAMARGGERGPNYGALLARLIAADAGGDSAAYASMPPGLPMASPAAPSPIDLPTNADGLAASFSQEGALDPFNPMLAVPAGQMPMASDAGMLPGAAPLFDREGFMPRAAQEGLLAPLPISGGMATGADPTGGAFALTPEGYEGDPTGAAPGTMAFGDSAQGLDAPPPPPNMADLPMQGGTPAQGSAPPMPAPAATGGGEGDGSGGFLRSDGFGNALQAIGMSLMSSPRNAPLQNFPQMFTALQASAQGRVKDERSARAIASVLMRSGVPAEEAAVLATTPDAARMVLEQQQAQAERASRERQSQGVVDVLAGGQGGQGEQSATVRQLTAIMANENVPAQAREAAARRLEQLQGGGWRPATQQEAAQYGAPAGQFGPDGRFYPQNPPSGFSIRTNPDGTTEVIQGPGAGGASGVRTEFDSKNATFATTARGALDILDQPIVEGGEPLVNQLGSFPDRMMDYDPTGVVRGTMQDPQFQAAQVAGNQWLMAVLRKETGAAITEPEQAFYGVTYLPRPGDTPEALEMKRQARIRVTNAIEAGLSPAALAAQTAALASTIAEINAESGGGAGPTGGQPQPGAAGDASGQPLPRPTSQAEYDAIPPGGSYIDSQGQVRRKGGQ